MKKLSFIFTFHFSIALMTFSVFGKTPESHQKPIIQISDGKPQLILPTEMQNALKKFDPHFVIWSFSDFIPAMQKQLKDGLPHSMLSAVVGDFNGDKKHDVALLGHNQKIDRTLVILSTKNEGYRVIAVDDSTALSSPQNDSFEVSSGHYEKGLHVCLNYSPAHSEFGIEGTPKKCPYESFSWYVFAKGGTDYCFINGKFLTNGND